MSNLFPTWFHNNQLISQKPQSEQQQLQVLDKIFENATTDLLSLSSSVTEESSDVSPDEADFDLLEQNLDYVINVLICSKSNNTSASSGNFQVARDFISKYGNK